MNAPARERAGPLLPADWPFDARRVPLFYGWVVLVLSTFGFLLSIPGQTMGMAVFTDAFIDAFGLTRTQLASAYFFGTLGSALFLTRAGRWYDRLGARVMITGASLVLGAVVALIAAIDVAAFAVAGAVGIAVGWISFPMILLCYFGVRFAGQGVLTSASRNVLLVWFDRRRGLVSGVRGVFVSLGFSIAPVVLALMIDALGWRGALLAMAGVVGIGFAFAALALVRDDPESCGLTADGRSAAADPVRSLRRDATLHDARRSPVFWIYSASLAMHALFGTAVTFHIVAIFAEAGRGRDEAFGYFLPQAVVSLTVNLIASTLADRYPLKPFLVAMLVAFIVGAAGLLTLESVSGYWLLVAGFGTGGGLWGVLSNLAFIRHFGRLHLGEISGLNTSITVFASALGPLAFSLANDVFDTYRAAAVGCLAGLALLFVASVAVRQD